jgi:hypothetical protein
MTARNPDRSHRLGIPAIRDSRSRLVALWPLCHCRVQRLGLSALRLLGTGHGVRRVFPISARRAVPTSRARRGRRATLGGRV